MAKREGEKRLTLALDGETYKRLRLASVDSGKTHQDICDLALREYLARVEVSEGV